MMTAAAGHVLGQEVLQGLPQGVAGRDDPLAPVISGAAGHSFNLI
jgi:hypothetical protein